MTPGANLKILTGESKTVSFLSQLTVDENVLVLNFDRMAGNHLPLRHRVVELTVNWASTEVVIDPGVGSLFYRGLEFPSLDHLRLSLPCEFNILRDDYTIVIDITPGTVDVGPHFSDQTLQVLHDLATEKTPLSCFERDLLANFFPLARRDDRSTEAICKFASKLEPCPLPGPPAEAARITLAAWTEKFQAIPRGCNRIILVPPPTEHIQRFIDMLNNSGVTHVSFIVGRDASCIEALQSTLVAVSSGTTITSVTVTFEESVPENRLSLSTSLKFLKLKIENQFNNMSAQAAASEIIKHCPQLQSLTIDCQISLSRPLLQVYFNSPRDSQLSTLKIINSGKDTRIAADAMLQLLQVNLPPIKKLTLTFDIGPSSAVLDHTLELFAPTLMSLSLGFTQRFGPKVVVPGRGMLRVPLPSLQKLKVVNYQFHDIVMVTAIETETLSSFSLNSFPLGALTELATSLDSYRKDYPNSHSAVQALQLGLYVTHEDLNMALPLFPNIKGIDTMLHDFDSLQALCKEASGLQCLRLVIPKLRATKRLSSCGSLGLCQILFEGTCPSPTDDPTPNLRRQSPLQLLTGLRTLQIFFTEASRYDVDDESDYSDNAANEDEDGEHCCSDDSKDDEDSNTNSSDNEDEPTTSSEDEEENEDEIFPAAICSHCVKELITTLPSLKFLHINKVNVSHGRPWLQVAELRGVAALISE